MNIHVVRPTNRKDREKLYRFLYDIWSAEFCRSMDGMNHEYRFLEDDLDKTADHFMALDESGQVLGCVRGNTLDHGILPKQLRENLQLEALGEVFPKRQICYASHFAVAPSARGKTVASLLIKALYRHYLHEEILVGISYSALHYISFYYQIGYRPYTENFRIDAGIRVPIIHCSRDRGYLEQIRSPLVKLCPPAFDDKGAAAAKLSSAFPAFRQPGFSRTKVHHLWARLAHIPPGPGGITKYPFFSDLSEAERETISRRGYEMTFSQGEYIYRRGETEKGIGILLAGSLGVEITTGNTLRIVYVILPGEPFGEMQSLGKGYRATNLVALEESQALLFHADMLEKIGSADRDLGYKLTQRLLNILAVRFAKLADTAIFTADSVNTPPRLPQLPSRKNQGDEIESRVESYRFDSLGDQEAEFRRLLTQATIGEDIEFKALEKMGIQNSTEVLDLGSGPGITSLLIARRYPHLSVIGVEPEHQLRSKAETLVASQGYGDRCRFVTGMGNNIPLENDCVDFSYARLLFQHLPNPVEVLEEMSRVTRPQGTIVVMDVDDRSNIIHPKPENFALLERRLANAQTASGGDRHVGRKLHGYFHKIGLSDITVTPVPITAEALGRDIFFSIVYSFKRQVLERAGELDEKTAELFNILEDIVLDPTSFAMTTVFVAHGRVP